MHRVATNADMLRLAAGAWLLFPGPEQGKFGPTAEGIALGGVRARHDTCRQMFGNAAAVKWCNIFSWFSRLSSVPLQVSSNASTKITA